MSYRPKIDGKSRKAARFLSNLQKSIQKALIDSGKTQQEIARILDVDRSVVNRRLSGSANLTARSIAEFAYAFEKDIQVRFVDKDNFRGTNTQQVSGAAVPMSGVTQAFTSGSVEPEHKFRIERIAS